MWFHEVVRVSVLVLEVAGVAAIVLGAAIALVPALAEAPRTRSEVYHRYRNGLGRAILLGLELFVAADIIRTVSDIPTLRHVLILGLIVLIRTFLSFTLEVELEGRWPWQRGTTSAPPPAPGGANAA